MAAEGQVDNKVEAVVVVGFDRSILAVVRWGVGCKGLRLDELQGADRLVGPRQRLSTNKASIEIEMARRQTYVFVGHDEGSFSSVVLSSRSQI